MTSIHPIAFRRHVPCEHCVTVAAGETGAKRRRMRRQELRCLPLDQCGNPSTYQIDGRPLCSAHAGRRALQILLETTK